MTDPTPTDAPATTLDTSSPAEVASVLAQLGGVLLSTETIQTSVELVTKLAAETIPATAGAGVSLMDSRGQRTAAASNTFVAEVDALQYTFNSGPCLTAWRDQAPVRVDDIALESRWPQWTAAAAALGIQAMLSVPLLSTGRSVGAIKVYSRIRDAYDVRAEHVLGLFAEQAAALLANMVALSDARQLSSQLTDALANRDDIGQAKGILMARGAQDDEQAFAMLMAAARRSNVKLHDVAQQLIASVTGNADGPRPT